LNIKTAFRKEYWLPPIEDKKWKMIDDIVDANLHLKNDEFSLI